MSPAPVLKIKPDLPSESPAAPGPGQVAAVGRLAALLQMEERLRQAEKKELPFIVVNETRLLVPYRQAVLWRAGDRESAAPMAVSGVAVPDKNAPYLQWLGRLCRHLRHQWSSPEIPSEPLAFNATDLPDDLREEWADWLPPQGIFVPLPLWPLPEASPLNPGGGQAASPDKAPLFGALTLFSQAPFSQADQRILKHLGGAHGHYLSLAFAARQRKMTWSRRTLVIAAAVALVLLLPIRQSVLAPAEIVSADPFPVRSSLEGVVESIAVTPNAEVKKGEVLLRLDATELATRHAVAVKSLEVARVELRQARQQALGEREAKLRLVYLNGRVEQLEAEKSYVESLMSRATIVSPIDGVALVDTPEEWAGKPVSLGQRIMTVAKPNLVRLEVFMPMEEFIPQEPGDEILFYPNISPGSPLDATITLVGYQAQETAQAGLAFHLRAELEPGQPSVRLGVRGSAKLYGSRAPLIYIILRKPIMKARQWLGF